MKNKKKDTNSTQDRAVSSVVGVILMVGITVILSSVVASYAIGFADETQEVSPFVGNIEGEATETQGGTIVSTTHASGESLDMSETEIVVSACGESERLVNLPVSGTGLTDSNIASESISDSIISGTTEQNSGFELGVLTSEYGDTTFTGGKSIEFMIDTSHPDCSQSTGDTITVEFVHMKTNSIVATEEIYV